MVITVSIQIDAHALIDAHPLHHRAPGTQQGVKLLIFIKNALINDQQSLYLKLFYSLMMHLRSNLDRIILYQPHVLLMPSGHLFE